MYVYLKSEPYLYTVGYYSPDGKWNPESGHESKEEAAKRVHYLNGGIEVKEEVAVKRAEVKAFEHMALRLVGRI